MVRQAPSLNYKGFWQPEFREIVQTAGGVGHPQSYARYNHLTAPQASEAAKHEPMPDQAHATLGANQIFAECPFRRQESVFNEFEMAVLITPSGAG